MNGNIFKSAGVAAGIVVGLIVAIALFAIAGCFLIVCAVRMWKKADQEDQEEKKQAAEDNSLK